MRPIVLTVLMGALRLAGQDSYPASPPGVGELLTDRPGFTESTEIAPKGWMQWEGGMQLDRSGDAHGYLFGAPLLRIGFSQRFELRFSTDGIVGKYDQTSPTKTGMADMGVGFKYKIVEEGRWRPAFSILPVVSLPSGHPNFSSSAIDPGVKFAWGKKGPAGFSLSGNLNYNSLTDTQGRFYQNATTFSVSHPLGDLGAYGEVYSFNRDERASGRMTVFQTGLTAPIGPNAQTDLSVARRLTAVGPEWMFAIGWVTRRPLRPSTWFR